MTWPVQSPLISVESMPYIATVSLSAAFLLAFASTTYVENYYHTLRNSVSRKSFSYKAPSLSILSSLLAGIGIVTLFNAVGVYL